MFPRRDAKGLIEGKCRRSRNVKEFVHWKAGFNHMLGGRLLGTVLVIGAGALAVAAVMAAPTVLRTARPIVRETLRRGIELYEQARAVAAEFAEDVEDLVAEVKADLSAAPADKQA